jgi:multidrug efflux pump subunit AcrB
VKVTDTAISLRIAILVLTVIAVVGGVFSYVTLPKESNPSIEIPTIVITTLYAGASPSDVENLITQRIEREIQAINGIDEIRSTSTEGVSTIVVEFTPEVAMDEANQKVRDKVDLAKPELPGDVEEPIISEVDPSEFPIMTVNLAAEYSLARLKELAEDLEDELESIASVLEVDLVGGLEREVRVEVDLAKLQGYNLSFKDISKVVQNENTNIPGGSIDVDELNYLVRVDGQFTNPREIEGLLVKAPGGKPIYVRDVAQVLFGFEDRESHARLRVLRRETPEGELVEVGEETYTQVISLNVKKRSGTNIIETSEGVRAVLEDFPFPPGTDILITGDQSKDVRRLVKDLENNIISGLLFVVGVLLFFLGVRTSILVGVAIPLSMLISFIVFSVMGQTLNFIILFSLIIALGMLVDNAIVIVENIYRYLEEGHGHWEAARRGTAEVGTAVVASTATTVAAFVPMLFWPGIIGEFMGFMPLTLIITLSCSLFVALVINPVVTGYLARVPGADRRAPSPRLRALGLGAFAAALLVLGLARPVTLAVVAGTGAVVYLLHTRLLSRIADRFTERGLPAVVEWYRGFLVTMLDRDYGVRWAFGRNATGLASFALGAGLLALGGGIFAVAGLPPAAVLLVPGGLLALLGLTGVLVHSLETLALGRMVSVKIGLVGGAVIAAALGLRALAEGGIAPEVGLAAAVLPGTAVLFGLLGRVVLGTRRHLILTDNRAKLLNTVFGLLIGIVIAFGVAPTGVEFFPTTDPNQIVITVEGRLGMNLEASNEIARATQRRLDGLLESSPRAEANIENILVNVGVGGDAAFGGGARSPERSRLRVNLVDYDDRNESSQVTLQRIRREIRNLAGVDVTIDKDQQGPPTGPPVNIEISGPDFDEIVRISEEVKAKLTRAAERGELEGLVDVRDNLDTGRPELQVRVDRERAARFGLSTAQIASTVRTAIAGEEVSKFRDGEDEYDIRVRLAESDRASLEAIRNLTFRHEGAQIPLVAVADVETGSGLGSITRLDQSRVVTVEGDAATGVNAQALLGRVKAFLADYQAGLPPGYTLAYTGESEDQQKSFSFLTRAFLIAAALIFMILVAQFNRVIGPLIIMVAVALSLIGVLLGLIVTRTPFGLMSFIGIISLAGIVVNNNIVLIDYTMQLRARGLEKQAAIVEAGATRLRPVLLTALTTVLGLIPLVFGLNIDFIGYLASFDPDFQLGSQNTQFWGPMGTAIISGLTFATFLTLVIIPVMYSLFDSAAGRLGRFLGLAPAG